MSRYKKNKTPAEWREYYTTVVENHTGPNKHLLMALLKNRNNYEKKDDRRFWGLQKAITLLNRINVEIGCGADIPPTPGIGKGIRGYVDKWAKSIGNTVRHFAHSSNDQPSPLSQTPTRPSNSQNSRGKKRKRKKKPKKQKRKKKPYSPQNDSVPSALILVLYERYLRSGSIFVTETYLLNQIHQFTSQYKGGELKKYEKGMSKEDIIKRRKAMRPLSRVLKKRGIVVSERSSFGNKKYKLTPVGVALGRELREKWDEEHRQVMIPPPPPPTTTTTKVSPVPRIFQTPSPLPPSVNNNNNIINPQTPVIPKKQTFVDLTIISDEDEEEEEEEELVEGEDFVVDDDHDDHKKVEQQQAQPQEEEEEEHEIVFLGSDFMPTPQIIYPVEEISFIPSPPPQSQQQQQQQELYQPQLIQPMMMMMTSQTPRLNQQQQQHDQIIQLPDIKTPVSRTNTSPFNTPDIFNITRKRLRDLRPINIQISNSQDMNNNDECESEPLTQHGEVCDDDVRLIEPPKKKMRRRYRDEHRYTRRTFEIQLVDASYAKETKVQNHTSLVRVSRKEDASYMFREGSGGEFVKTLRVLFSLRIVRPVHVIFKIDANGFHPPLDEIYKEKVDERDPNVIHIDGCMCQKESPDTNEGLKTFLRERYLIHRYEVANYFIDGEYHTATLTSTVTPKLLENIFDKPSIVSFFDYLPEYDEYDDDDSGNVYGEDEDEEDDDDEEEIDEEEDNEIKKIMRNRNIFDDFELILVIDQREFDTKHHPNSQQDQVVEMLTSNGVNVIVRQIDLGDYLFIIRNKRTKKEMVCNEFICERKTIDDLMSSMTSGRRYFEQKHRLGRIKFKSVYYLLEGEVVVPPPDHEYYNNENNQDYDGLFEKRRIVEKAVVNISLQGRRNSNDRVFHVKRTRKWEETVEWLTCQYEVVKERMERENKINGNIYSYVEKEEEDDNDDDEDEIDDEDEEEEEEEGKMKKKKRKKKIVRYNNGMSIQEFNSRWRSDRDLTHTEIWGRQLNSLRFGSRRRVGDIVEVYPTLSSYVDELDDPEKSEEEKKRLLERFEDVRFPNGSSDDDEEVSERARKEAERFSSFVYDWLGKTSVDDNVNLEDEELELDEEEMSFNPDEVDEI